MLAGEPKSVKRGVGLPDTVLSDGRHRSGARGVCYLLFTLKAHVLAITLIG